MTSHTPLLSILIATYNRAKYLEELLGFIEKEKSDEVEVLVNDNASTDNTSKMMSEKKFDVSYHRNEKNLGGTLNTIDLIKKAKGEYILSLSDNDLLVYGGITSILDLIKKSPEATVIFSPCKNFEDKSGERKFLDTVFFQGPQERVFKKGREGVEAIFARATLLSGLVMKRECMDLAGYENHIKDRYPHLYLAGVAATKGPVFYTNYPFVLLRSNTPKFWSYSPDYLCGSVLNIAKGITARLNDNGKTYSILVEKRVRQVFSALLDARGRSFSIFLKSVRALTALPEYRNHWRFWFWVTIIGLLGDRLTLTLGRLIKKFRFRATSSLSKKPCPH